MEQPSVGCSPEGCKELDKTEATWHAHRAEMEYGFL